MTATIALVPDYKVFSSAQVSKLEAELESIDNFTTIETVNSPSDIQLGTNFLTLSGKNQLTTVALTQLCGALCPGLNKVVSDVAGLGQLFPEKAVKPSLALELYNKVASFRFEQLQDKSVVYNLKHKRIDGIIGAGYRTLSNKTLFEITQDAISDTSAVFHEGILFGRTLILSYRFDKPFTDKPDTYYGGFYFTNSEVGDCSVRIASLVMNIKTNEKAIRTHRKGRMVHIGRNFATRVRKSIFEAANKPWSEEYFKSRMQSLPSISLGLTGSEKEDEDKINNLITILARRGLSAQIAERVMFNVLYQGNKSQDNSMTEPSWSKKTVYDLFLSLIRDAKNRTLSTRETLERAAYDILAGSVKL